MPVTLSQLKEKRREYLLLKNEVDVLYEKKANYYKEYDAARTAHAERHADQERLVKELDELGRNFALNCDEEDIQEKLPT